MEDSKNSFKVLIGKPFGKKPLGKPRWEDNTRKDVAEVGIKCMNWLRLGITRELS